jgi:uncharacterized SAM-binding protein YcdF (DUF218 family)
MALFALTIFYLAATPWLADYVDANLVVPSNPAVSGAGAIVVLGGDVERVRDGGTLAQLGAISLRRVFLAAAAYRRTGLPVLVSGGTVAGTRISVAELMSQALVSDFAVPVRWRETRSQNTYENAAFSASILKKAGIRTILLASQRRDFPRAAWSFDRFGIAVDPATPPAPMLSTGDFTDFMPSPRALLRMFYALHEQLGLVYYRIAYAG